MAEPHIRAASLRKTYVLGGNEIVALENINLDLDRGEFVALCGPSGSGKTTLLNILGCLDTPSSGQVIISGRDVSRLGDEELAGFRASQLGFVFQTFNLLSVLSAVENVEYPLLKLGIGAKERRARAMEALARVGLVRFAPNRPSQLSGGQRQRVAIARAFVTNPELIIADEPTANLDQKTAGGILDLMGELNQTMKLTIIVATHDPIVMSRASRRVAISDGHLQW